SRRNTKRCSRFVSQRDLEEIFRNGRCKQTTSGATDKISRLVVTEINADSEIGRKPDKPRVFLIVGGSGLACARLADLTEYGCGAALNHPLHQCGDLVGCHRIKRLLAAIDQHWLTLALLALRRV